MEWRAALTSRISTPLRVVASRDFSRAAFVRKSRPSPDPGSQCRRDAELVAVHADLIAEPAQEQEGLTMSDEVSAAIRVLRLEPMSPDTYEFAAEYRLLDALAGRFSHCSLSVARDLECARWHGGGSPDIALLTRRVRGFS